MVRRKNTPAANTKTGQGRNLPGVIGGKILRMKYDCKRFYRALLQLENEVKRMVIFEYIDPRSSSV